MLQMSGGEGFIFKSLFGKTLRNSSQAIVVKTNLDCREICAGAAVVEYQQTAEPCNCHSPGDQSSSCRAFWKAGKRENWR